MSANSVIRRHYFKFERGVWIKDGEKPATHWAASGFVYTNALTLAQRDELDELILAFMRKIDGTRPATSETAEPSGARTLLGLPVTIDGAIPSDEAHLVEPDGTRHRITEIDSAEPSGAALAGWLDGLREAAREAIRALEDEFSDGGQWKNAEAWEVRDNLQTALAQLTLTQLAGNTGQLQAAERCSLCDNTGDIHDATGEWRGSCPHCKVPEQAAEGVSEPDWLGDASEAPKLPRPFHAQASSFGWPDLYTADQMRAYALAARRAQP